MSDLVEVDKDDLKSVLEFIASASAHGPPGSGPSEEIDAAAQRLESVVFER